MTASANQGSPRRAGVEPLGSAGGIDVGTVVGPDAVELQNRLRAANRADGQPGDCQTEQVRVQQYYGRVNERLRKRRQDGCRP